MKNENEGEFNTQDKTDVDDDDDDDDGRASSSLVGWRELTFWGRSSKSQGTERYFIAIFTSIYSFSW